MATLYNTQTRLPEELPPDKLVQALANGTHSYKADDRITVTGQDGSVRNVSGSELIDAMRQGFMPETPRQAAVREYVDENKGIGGAAKVALGQFADEALFSVPETIFDLTADPLEVAKKEALKKEHALTNALAGVAGFGASLFYGGPVFKAATTAGRFAERTALGIGEEAILRTAAEREGTALGEAFATREAAANLPKGILTGTAGEQAFQKMSSQAVANFEQQALKERLVAAGFPASQADYAAAGLIRRTAAAAANMGVQAGVIAAPKTITEALLGDPEKAAEHLLYTVGAGAALGGFGSLGGSLAKAAKNVAGQIEDQAVLSLTKRQIALDALDKIGTKEAQLGRALTEGERKQFLQDVGAIGPEFIGLEKPGSTLKEAIGAKVLGESPFGAGLTGAALDVGLLGGTGLTGAATGYGLSKAAKTFMEEPAKIVDGILFAEKAMKRGAEMIDKVPEMLSKAIPAEALSTMHLNAISRFIGEDVSKMTEQEKYDKIYEKLALMQNPDVQASKIANITSVLSQGGAPEIAQAMTLNMQKLYNYLWQTLPRTSLDHNPFVSANENKARAQIANSKMREFEKALAVVMDPFLAFQKAGTGTLTANEIKMLQTFYPGILDDVGKKIQNNPQQYSYDTRLKASQLTGVDMGTGKVSKRATRPLAGFPMPRFKPTNINLYGVGNKPNIANTAIQDLTGRRIRNR